MKNRKAADLSRFLVTELSKTSLSWSTARRKYTSSPFDLTHISSRCQRQCRKPRIRLTRCLRMFAANSGPNLFHHHRAVYGTGRCRVRRADLRLCAATAETRRPSSPQAGSPRTKNGSRGTAKQTFEDEAFLQPTPHAGSSPSNAFALTRPAKGSNDKPLNIGACNTASSPPNINSQTRPALR